MTGLGIQEGVLADEDLARLLMIRRFEEKLLELFARGELNGTTHTCLGQEYIPVALEPLLHEHDFVFSNHRGHGHYLARYGDPAGLLAEIMGREGAVCQGVGGSQHILRDRYLSTGVQGESMPVAVGVALSLKRREPGRLACVYIGDGTWGEGAVYEALNMARLWDLPLLVVVENNGIAQSTPTSVQMAGTIAARAQAFDIAHVLIESVDPGQIRAVLTSLVDQVRAGEPLVAEFVTHRVGPHSKGDDSRSAAELASIQDWYVRYKSLFPEQVSRLDAYSLIESVYADVSARPAVTWEHA